MHWAYLESYFRQNPIKGIKFTECILSVASGNLSAHKVEEYVGEHQFIYVRDVKGGKMTLRDDLGLVGLNSLDLSKNKCYITEGVSDFLAVKFLTGENVLGRTKLSVSGPTLKILMSLFDNYILVGDPDPTGFKALMEWRALFQKYGKNVVVTVPPGNDDAAKYFTRELKLKGWQSQQSTGRVSLKMW